MPRTKGAKNKEKPLQYYIDKVKELGGDTELIHVLPKAKKAAENVAEVVENPVQKTAKKAFEILKPKKETPPPDINGEVYRCGNPACGKVLDGALSKCPYCGVNLQWQ